MPNEIDVGRISFPGCVTQHTVCVVEFSTLIHLDHSFFEIRALFLGTQP